MSSTALKQGGHFNQGNDHQSRTTVISTNPLQPLSNSTEYLHIVDLIKANDFVGLESLVKQYNGDISFNGIIFSMLDKTPLMIASIYGHIECIDVLLRHGACVNGIHSSGISALFYAIKFHQYHAARHLIENYHPILSSTIREKSTNRDMLLTVVLEIRKRVLDEQHGTNAFHASSLPQHDPYDEPPSPPSESSTSNLQPMIRDLQQRLFTNDLPGAPSTHRKGGTPTSGDDDDDLFTPIAPSESFCAEEDTIGGPPADSPPPPPPDTPTSSSLYPPAPPSDLSASISNISGMHGGGGGGGGSGDSIPHTNSVKSSSYTIDHLIDFFSLLLSRGSFSTDLCDIHGDSVESVIRQLKLPSLFTALKKYRQTQYDMYESCQRWVFDQLFPACKAGKKATVTHLLQHYIVDRSLPPELLEDYITPQYPVYGANSLPIKPYIDHDRNRLRFCEQYYRKYAIAIAPPPHITASATPSTPSGIPTSNSTPQPHLSLPPLAPPLSLSHPPQPSSLSTPSTPPPPPPSTPSFLSSSPSMAGMDISAVGSTYDDTPAPPPPSASQTLSKSVNNDGTGNNNMDEDDTFPPAPPGAYQLHIDHHGDDIPPPPQSPSSLSSTPSLSIHPSLLSSHFFPSPPSHFYYQSIPTFTDYSVPYLYADVRDASNNTVLSHAVLVGDLHLIDILIYYGASLSSVNLQYGTILMTAVHSQNPNTLIHLLSRYFTPMHQHLMSTVNYRDSNDKSILEIAHDRLLSHPTYLYVFVLLLNLSPNMIASKTDRTFVSFLIDADSKDQAILQKRMNEREMARQHGHVDDAFVSSAEKALHARMSHRVTLLETILHFYPQLALLDYFDGVGMCSFDILQTAPQPPHQENSNSLTITQLIIDAYVRGNLLGLVNAYGETLLQKAEVFDDKYKIQTLMLYHQRTPRQQLPSGAPHPHITALLTGSSLFSNTNNNTNSTSANNNNAASSSSQPSSSSQGKSSSRTHHRASIAHPSGLGVGAMTASSARGGRDLVRPSMRMPGVPSQLSSLPSKSRLMVHGDNEHSTQGHSSDPHRSSRHSSGNGGDTSSTSPTNTPAQQPFRELMLLRIIDASSKIQSDFITKISSCLTSGNGLVLSFQSIVHCVKNNDFAGLKAYHLHSPLHFDWRSRDSYGKTIFQVIQSLPISDVQKVESLDLITSILSHRAEASTANPLFDHPQFHTADYLQRVFAELRTLIIQKPSPFYAPERREQILTLAAYKKDKKLLKMEKEREKQREKIEKQREKFEKEVEHNERELSRQREKEEEKLRKTSSGFSLFSKKPPKDIIIPDQFQRDSIIIRPKATERRRQSLADVEYMASQEAYRASITLTYDDSASTLSLPTFRGDHLAVAPVDGISGQPSNSNGSSYSPASRNRLGFPDSSQTEVLSNVSTPRFSNVGEYGGSSGVSRSTTNLTNTPLSQFDYVDPATGLTPLIAAIQACNIYLVEALLLLGTNPDFKLDPLFNPQIEQFPLFYAISAIPPETPQAQYNAAGNPSPSNHSFSNINLDSSSSSNTPLSSLKHITNHTSKPLKAPSLPSPHYASSASTSHVRDDHHHHHSSTPQVDSLVNIKMSKLLLYHGANPYLRNDLRGTLYHYMFWSSVASLETVVFVHNILPQYINAYYDDDSKRIGATPLHWLVNRKNVDEHIDVLEYLLAQGADVNLCLNLDNPKAGERNGSNALHLAVSKPGNIATVELLLHNGVDPKLKNNKGKTPKDLAVEKSYATLIQSFIMQQR